jgi:hypothetical protein
MSSKLKKKVKSVPAAPLKLDLGCGPHPKEGFEGVDKIDFKQKYVLDLAEPADEVHRHWGNTFMRWPWGNESVDEVHSSHFLEHLTNEERIHFYNELYRVLKKDAKVTIIVPHWSSGRAYGDPTHKMPPVVEFSLYYLDKGWREVNAPHCGLTCDFLATWYYSIHPTWQARNQETQLFGLNHYREVAQDLLVTLVKR